MTRVAIRQEVRDLRPFVPGKPLEEARRELGTMDVLKLASNENPLGASPKAIARAQTEMGMLSYYPDPGGVSLKEKLAEMLGLCAAQLVLGNGSEDILTLAAAARVQPGDEVIISDCAFSTYRVIAEKFGAKPVVAPMKDWGHHLAEMLARISERTALVYLDNPRNPTGTTLSLADVVAFMAEVPKTVLVVLDEAYYEYRGPHHDLDGSKLVGTFDNLLVTRTFSKVHGLAGLRLGYGISDQEVIAVLERTRMPFNVNRIALAAGVAALDDREHLRRSLAENAAGKKILYEFFTGLGLSVLPANGNFMTVLLPCAASVLYERLLRRRIIVRALAEFGMPRAVRVTVGSLGQIERFMPCFREELRAIQREGDERV